MDELAYENLNSLLRGYDTKNFTMSITCRGGVWSVAATSFDPPNIYTSAGVGNSFAEAYNAQIALVPDAPEDD